MSDFPLAELLLSSALEYERTLYVSAEGRVPGVGGSLFIELSPDKPLPPPYDLRGRPGNTGINPNAPLWTITTTVGTFDTAGMPGEIALRHADGQAILPVQVAGTGPDRPSAWVAAREIKTGPNALVRVLGTVIMSTGGYSVDLVKNQPQGPNPSILILTLAIKNPQGPVPEVITPVAITYQERDLNNFTHVTIMPDNITTPVRPPV